MRKMLVIAVREYQAAVRTKAFLITLFAMPVLWGGSIVVHELLEGKVDTRDKRFAVVDRTGQLFDAVARATEKRNTEGIFDNSGRRGEGESSDDDARGILSEHAPSGDGSELIKAVEASSQKQVKPRFLVERVPPSTDDDATLKLKLSDRVRAGELVGFVIIGPNVINPGPEPAGDRIAYYSNSPTYDDFQDWVAGPINKRIQELRFASAKLDPHLVSKITKKVNVGNLGLVKVDAQGNISEAKETNEKANILFPVGLMMLMLMVVMIGASPLIQSVLEEKMQRIAEVLLGSVSPFQLMMGKLLGTVGVSLTIGTVYLTGGFIALYKSGYGDLFPAGMLVWYVVFLALAVLMFGSVFIAIGAAVTDLKEAQALTTPVMIIVVSPMFVWFNVVREPASTFSLVASLIPPATPMLMTLRQAVPPGVPVWQPALGVILVLMTTLLCVVAAGRIFRVGILMQGKGAKIGQMMQWVFRG